MRSKSSCVSSSGNGQDDRFLFVLQAGDQLKRRSDAVADHHDQLARLEPRRRFAAITDEDRAEPFSPEAFEGLVQSKRYALDQNDDRRGSGSRGAAHLIFDECPPGEGKQSCQPAGIVFLIGSNQSAERQAIPLTFTPSPAAAERTPNRFCNGFRAGTKMVNCRP